MAENPSNLFTKAIDEAQAEIERLEGVTARVLQNGTLVRNGVAWFGADVPSVVDSRQ